ncbi:putative toxin-antitoxin system toxin component, PIN family [Algoriphagus formosus]|uniref:putative toxin-antitoxin system toxin component, PIN family n=1 Tax=Algoriphagus formosus TaxID=2007308 RepID=UPI000C2878E8
MKVILDTNVLISALIAKSYPSKVLEAIFSNQEIILCLSDAVFNEYSEVLKRPKFARFKEFHSSASFVLQYIKREGTFYNPKRSLELLKDQSDNKFLELSLECKADYLITGNFNDFNISQFRNTKILSPKEFYTILSTS